VVRRGAPLALLLAGLLVSGATALQGVQVNDEGLMLAAAERVARGQVPYRDFWANYPPGQYHLLGALSELFGTSLVPWRVVRVLADAGVAALTFVLARRGGAPGRLAGVAWVAAICSMASPSGPNPFPVALALALGALLVFERAPVAAGALAGACAAWRTELAAGLVLGVLAALLLSSRRGERAPAARFAAAAGGTAALLYAPVVARAGLGPAWDLLVRHPLTEYRTYQGLPFPFGYDGPLNVSSPLAFLDDSLEPGLLFFLPLVLVVGLAAGGAEALRGPGAPLRIATAGFALGPLSYLLARPDFLHTAPLAVVVAGLAAWAVAARPRAATGVVAGLALAYVVVQGLDRRWLALREETRRLDLPVADGVRTDPAVAAELEGAVAAIDRLAPPGAPIYVATRRSDRVTSGSPLLYVLARRPNPTRHDVAQPGVVTTAAVQREIVRDLERTRTPVVVRDTAARTAAPEPNAGGRSSGVRLLDAHLARRYRPVARVGSLRLLVRRP